MENGAGKIFTVLIVEDEEDNCEIMRSVVEEILGYRALLAGNGRAAIALLKENQPDLILMDLMMPVLDGFEATARIKADPATRHIPVIAVTAMGRAAERLRILEGGADGYITKPFNLEMLVDVVERYAQSA
jgi:two-component system, cell cycle response regulator DivK